MKGIVENNCTISIYCLFILFFSSFYRYDFKGIIDYIFYSKEHMNLIGLLGPLDEEWFRQNKVVGCPHPHVPSDHFPLLVEFEMPARNLPNSQGNPPLIQYR